MINAKKEYDIKYGDVPYDQQNRLDYLLKKVASKRGFGIDLTKEIHRILNIRWVKLSYTIYLVPKGTPRPRSGRGNHFYVKGASDNKRFFKEFYARWNTSIHIKTACRVDCKSYLPIPSAMKRYEQVLAELGLIRPLSKPDFDNLVKAYCDMIQGIILKDDSLIIGGSSDKFYSVKPRIEFTIWYAEEYDSEFNKKKVERMK